MNEVIKNLTGKDLEYLSILAKKSVEDDPKFWEIIQQFSVLERLNRKTYNVKILDFSALNEQELENALITSLSYEQIFQHRNRRLTGFFGYITNTIERLIYHG